MPELERLPGIFHLFLGKAVDPAGPDANEDGLFPRPFTQERMVRLRQVHGTRIAGAMRAEGGAPPGVVEADGAITDEPGLLLRVGVADCLAIFLVDPEGPMIGLVHAGWRGLAAGAVETAVAALEDRGARSARLVAAVGPSIGPCCYEVGEDVARALGPGAHPGLGPSGRPHVDLFGDARARLLAAGVPGARIAPRPPCTACSEMAFHSHRASGGLPGRNEAFLGIRPGRP